MNKKLVATGVVCLVSALGISTTWLIKRSNFSGQSLSDQALLALIKNDQRAFEKVIAAGVDMETSLPTIDQKTYSIAEGMAYFERVEFIKYLQSKKVRFLVQKAGRTYDMLSLAVENNNLEILKQLSLEKPNYQLTYGEKEWSLLHIASSTCAHKLTAMLHEEGKLSWDKRAKDGSTPLTLAAQNDCLPILSYWKEHKADFNKKDGRGLSALSILKKKKDAALLAFVESFELRRPTSVKSEVVSFYKKRKIPKDQIVDHSALIEPEERPMEATETAEFSEFAD